MTDSSTELLPIRTVSKLTGVNAVTLRAWERRYGLLRPRRTHKGHRLYTREDVRFINNVVTQLEAGTPISRIPARDPVAQAASDARAPESNIWTRYQDRMIEAVERFDEARLDAAYNEALSLYPITIITAQILVPLLRRLGERWEDKEGTVAEEHFFGVYLRGKLGARLHHRARNEGGPRLLAACLPGENHEVGLTLFTLAAHERGYHVVLLGADIPLGELEPAARIAASDGIVLAGSMTPGPAILSRDLPDLVHAVRVPVFVGGRVSVAHADAIARTAAIPVGEGLDAALRRIGERITGRTR